MTDEDRKVHYIDVGDMPKEEAINAINEIRVNLGKEPIKYTFIDKYGSYIFFTLIVFDFILYLLNIIANSYV